MFSVRKPVTHGTLVFFSHKGLDTESTTRGLRRGWWWWWGGGSGGGGGGGRKFYDPNQELNQQSLEPGSGSADFYVLTIQPCQPLCQYTVLLFTFTCTLGLRVLRKIYVFRC